MPSLSQRNYPFNDAPLNHSSSSASFDGSVLYNGFWSQNRCDVSCNQLQKFWSGLSPQARQELLRVDKQSLFEQARKNMYCSRCNGLLLESFLQIIMYGKSSEQDGVDVHEHSPDNIQGSSSQDECVSLGTDCCQCESHDPSIHPWGGLTMTKDGALTLLDCYICSNSLSGIQNVFDSARAREREREMLYPDACGGGSRGWISQGMSLYGRGHGTRETCALHSARLSCDTLVDFWSALGEETRKSLLRMKEEDFIERLVYRFDSKRFCRDCRRNVIREFKELKELKRVRKEPHCTTWFCAADTDFQYEVSEDSVQADWSQKFFDTFKSYNHFEWAVGTAEGKSDILEFENVGKNGNAYADGLDLQGLNSCCITIKAWKEDGRCTEHYVKAYALKGRQCVHCRLAVGDGFVAITRGENIRYFFEHAEEAEEEEDDESIDDGNELDGECSRPQKHAKSPELAREFLLDAAAVIFKEQVEKAFREGTARQNAHSIFITLALKLLEERIHVACKEIITLEKQMKLLEEEEKEKREEEERKERRRIKEREKKLRRKERLRQKENAGENKSFSCSNETTDIVRDGGEIKNVDSASDTDDTPLSCQHSPDAESEQLPDEHSKYLHHEKKYTESNSTTRWHETRKITGIPEGREGRTGVRNETTSWVVKGLHRQTRINPMRAREKFQPYNSRTNGRYRSYYCSCSLTTEYKAKDEQHGSMSHPRQFYRCGTSNQQGKVRTKSCVKVWERMQTEKKCLRSSSDSDFTLESGSTHDHKAPNDPQFCVRSSSSAIIGSNTSRTSSSDICSSEGEGESNAVCSSPSNADVLSISDSDETQIKESVDASMEKPGDSDGQNKINEVENHVNVTTGLPTQAPPPIQSLHFPVFHPQVGIYPPPTSLFPFAHPYQYLFTNPLQYTTQVSDTPPKVPKSTGEGQTREGAKSLSNGFSLFHFGGPVALSSALKSKSSDAVLPKFPLDYVDTCCGKETTVEQYNLFAASNGLRFSFF